MTARDIVMSAAGNSGDSKTYVEDVFSTYLFNGAGQGNYVNINNGIDLAGKGGLFINKVRNSTGSDWGLYDSARGWNNRLVSNLTDAEWANFPYEGVTATSTGPSFKTFYGSSTSYASWTFRKAPKFFDVVTWTGDGVAGRSISHSLGQAPGMIIVKRTNAASGWGVWHRSVTNNGGLALNTTEPSSSYSFQNVFGNGTNVIAPTSSSFTVGSSLTSNGSGDTYVAYIFAHDTTTDGLIQCSSFVADGSGNATVNLGWEPQYLMWKAASESGNWYIDDTMRGWSMTSYQSLRANLSDAENTYYGYVTPSVTGFNMNLNGLTAGATYIYMAIRRGPMRTPTDGTTVFKALTRNGTGTTTPINGIGFSPDLIITRSRASTDVDFGVCDRLRGTSIVLATNNTNADFNTGTGSSGTVLEFGNDGVTFGADDYTWSFNRYTGRNYINYLFKRAPGFFDVVCYTGAGGVKTVNHNLGVAPELMIVKNRSNASDWVVYTSSVGNTKALVLNDTIPPITASTFWNNTNPTSSVFTVGNTGNVNGANETYVAYLFASCPGVSKVGSFTNSGADINVNCGFTNGARFVLIKQTDSASDWMVFDTARGINSGNDPYLALNSTSAENWAGGFDFVAPYSAGFTFKNANWSTGNYIYLAIA